MSLSLLRRLRSLATQPTRTRVCEHCLDFETTNALELGDHEALCYQPPDPADFWTYPLHMDEEI